MMSSIGVFLSKPEQGLLFRKFDRTGDGSISYDEFITAVRGELTPARLELVEKAFARLVSACVGRMFVGHCVAPGLVGVWDLERKANVRPPSCAGPTSCLLNLNVL